MLHRRQKAVTNRCPADSDLQSGTLKSEMNPLAAIEKLGQSVWIDALDRASIRSGELARLIEQDGVRGAIARESLDVDDVRLAADLLRPVFEQSHGMDGFISIDVPAGSTAQNIDRPNVMVQAPATMQGLAAIETWLAERIPIHATQMFSLRHCEALACTAHGSRPALAASFSVSPVDTVVDHALENLGTPEALDLRGKIAIANAKAIYQRYCEIFGGGRMPRLLWACTSTRNPAYSDVRYVEELIGPGTITALCPATLRAFREHGRVRGATVTQGIQEAHERLARLATLGIDLPGLSLTTMHQKFHAIYV
jgi:transaldolase